MQNLSFGHFPVAKEKVQSPSPTSQEKSEHLEPVGDQSPVHQVDNLNQCLVHNVEDLNKSPVHHVDTLKQSSVHNVDDLNQSPVHHVDVINSQRFKMKKTALDSPMGSYPLTNDKRGFQGSVQQEGGAGSKAKCYTPSTSSEKEISEYSVRTQYMILSKLFLLHCLSFMHASITYHHRSFSGEFSGSCG